MRPLLRLDIVSVGEGRLGINLGRPWRRLAGTRTLAVGLLLAVAALGLACGDDGDDDGRLRVVASTALIADLVHAVAEDDVDLFTTVPSGADVHGFSPSPELARRVAEADVVIVNGYNLEESVLDVILENRDGDALLVVAAEGLTALDGDDGEEDLATAAGDPHLWLSVRNAMVYVRNIATALVAADPEHAAAYREREEAYLAELQALDEEVRAAVAEIERPRRLLVVFHDSFQYFAEAYGLELAAAVLPASASQQASAGDVAEIIELVEERAVPAVYREPQFSSDALDAIADETGARVLTLYSGAFTDEVDGYIELMRANAEALRNGLGDGLGGD